MRHRQFHNAQYRLPDVKAHRVRGNAVRMPPLFDPAEVASDAAASLLRARVCGRVARARQNWSAVVRLTVRSTSIEFERSTPGRRINTSV